MVGLKAATTASDVLKAGVDSYRRFGRHESVSIVDLAADAATVGLSAHDLGTFQRQARGWIRGIHKPTAPAWKAWAAKVAVYGDGRPRSWQALRSARPSVAKDISGEALEAAAIELAADLVDDPQPATRRLTDLGRGLRSAAARMTHRVRVAPWPPTLETS